MMPFGAHVSIADTRREYQKPLTRHSAVARRTMEIGFVLRCRKVHGGIGALTLARQCLTCLNATLLNGR